MLQKKTKKDFEGKVKVGDRIRIVPIDSVPNAEREFKVNALLNEGFLYGLSTTCDGYVIPYSWVKSFKVIPAQKSKV